MPALILIRGEPTESIAITIEGYFGGWSGVEWSGVCRAVIFDFSDCTRLIYDSSYSRDFNVGHVVPRVTRVEPQQPTSKIKLEAQIKSSAQIGNL